MVIFLNLKSCFGESRHSNSVRLLAYEMLGELVKALKGEFNAQHLSKLVLIFAKCLHDSSINIQMQAFCARRLMDLVDNVFKLNEGDPKRNWLSFWS